MLCLWDWESQGLGGARSLSAQAQPRTSVEGQVPLVLALGLSWNHPEAGELLAGSLALARAEVCLLLPRRAEQAASAAPGRGRVGSGACAAPAPGPGCWRLHVRVVVGGQGRLLQDGAHDPLHL